MTDVIMSFIFNSFYGIRALESIGSKRRIVVVDNSFCGELKTFSLRNPHVHYLRPTVRAAIDPVFSWEPLSCAQSWNLAIQHAESEWVVNVNPDVALSHDAFKYLDLAIDGRPDGCVLFRSQIGFNVWAGDRKWLLEHPFDERFKPCGAEDEDILVQIAQDGKKWGRLNIPAIHVDGGHKDRVDGYCNTPVFERKHGFPPNCDDYRKIVGPACLGGGR